MRSPSRRKGSLQPIGGLVSQVLADLGAGQTARAVRIAESWERAVGPEIALHCQPLGIRGGVLEASVDSSVWCQQLQLRKPEILAALRRVVGEDAPSDIRLHLASAAPETR